MDALENVTEPKKKTNKVLMLNQVEEQHLLAISTSATNKNISKNTMTLPEKNVFEANNTSRTQICATSMSTKTIDKHSLENEQHEQNDCNGHSSKLDITIAKKKSKSKKRTRVSEKQNIAMKSSFNKFDALQKRNLIHVRSNDAGKAQEKFSNLQGEQQKNCRHCDKPVYKMEEVKAERNIFHKNCFRCHECSKHLKVDTYQSHEGILYCTIHFKLLFAPKLVENNEPVQEQKPELIIRENNPTELPSDVFRASDKPNLGLEELHQLNLRSRFKVFENRDENKREEIEQQDLQIIGKKNATCNANTISDARSTISDSNKNTISLDSYDTNSKDMQKHKPPIGLGEAMNDIFTLFEKGLVITKEERREERKQEIQNIRSRLFMGKQARIKEMYQQAVADSNQAAADKRPDISIDVDSKSLRERFEKGEATTAYKYDNEEDNSKISTIEKDADLFELGISKKSRSIFMELDASVINGKQNNMLPYQSTNRRLQNQKSLSKILGSMGQSEQESTLHKYREIDVVKCGEAIEDVQIQTSEISEKFKFFETYHPTENKKHVFRITPPRDGVVKMPSPDNNSTAGELNNESPDSYGVTHSRTTSMIINKFHELEKNQEKYSCSRPKPLKCFTPPSDNRRLYDLNDSVDYGNDDNDDDNDVDENDEDGDFYNYSHSLKDDEPLKEAQNAAHAKKIRAKFEKWEAYEIRNENDNDRKCIGITIDKLSDDSIGSTQSIREQFEKMRNAKQPEQHTTLRHQVKRFV